MELVPVGVGAAYGLPHEGQSCYLVRTPDRAVVLDLGSGTLNRLCALVAPQDLDAVVISHLHPDHCVDLMSLRIYMLWGPGAGGRLRLLGPQGLRERLTAFSGSEGWDEAFAFEELGRPGGRADLGGGLVLRYREVPHLPPTFAMRLEWGGAALCYRRRLRPRAGAPRAGRRVRRAGVRGVVRGRAGAGGRAPPAGPGGGPHRRPGGGRPPAAHPLRAGIRPRRRPRGRAGRVPPGPVDWARQGEPVIA